MAVLLPAVVQLSCDDALLASAAEAVDVMEVADVADVADAVDAAAGVPAVGGGTAAIAPANAPLSAFSRSASALDTGSASECLPEGSFDASVEDLLLPLAGAALVDTVPAAGVVASDWASAAEKSSVPAPDCVVV